MGSKGTNTTTSTTGPTQQAMSAYSDLLNRAQGVAATPFNPYGGEFVAPVNSQQQLGINNINAAQPVFGQALTMAQNAAQPITAAQIQQYESPYTQAVVNATQAQFNNQNAQAAQGVNGQAIAQGALGGNRIGVAQAELANQQQLAQAPVIAGLVNQGYTTGLNTALTEQQAMAQGAYGVSSAGQGMLGAAGAQMGAGGLQQQTQQAQDSALYNQYLQQQAYPFQTAQWLAGIDTGVGSQMGGTSSTTAPAPSMLGQAAGALTSGVGMLGATGAFGAAGWLAPAMAMLATGGRVPSPGIANREPTMPETDDTLRAQQQQLTAGHRRVQMFPSGTPELPVPQGMQRTQNENGAFHYDPRRIDENEIHHLSARGRENEFLDLGPYSKDDILHRLRGGEIPIAVVERHPDGTEVRAAAGTHKTAHHQMAAMHRTKSPGNHVRIEDPRETIGARMRGGGGRIQGFAGGGDVPPPPGLDLTGQPYAGGHGWVPTMPMAHGAGAPRAPGVAPPQQTDLAKQAGEIGSLAKLINSGGQGHNGLATDAQNNGTGIYTGPEYLPGFSGASGDGMSTGGMVHRASGGVANMPIMVPRGYADGGAPYDGDYFNETFAAPIQHTAPMYEIAANRDAMADYTARARDVGLAGNPAAAAPPPQMAGIAPAYDLPSEITDGSSLPVRRVRTEALGYNGSPVVRPLPGDGLASPPPRAAAADDPDALPPPPEDGGRSFDTAPTARGVAPSGIDWSSNGKLWPSLMAAGFGMMASKSPFAGVAIGEGGLAGTAAYSTARQQENAQKLSERKIDLEVKSLQQRADIAARPYKESTVAEKDRLAEQRDYHKDLTSRMQLRPTGTMTSEGHPIFIDGRTGQSVDGITGEPIDAANVKVQPMAGKPGANETLARSLVADREKEREKNPALPSLSLEEAVGIVHKAPNGDQATMRRLGLAQSAWRAWLGNPINMGKKDAPEANLDFWEKRYATQASPNAPAAAAPAPAAAAAAPAAEPPRPPSVPAEAKLQRNKANPSLYRWVAPDGTIYSADGAKQ